MRNQFLMWPILFFVGASCGKGLVDVTKEVTAVTAAGCDPCRIFVTASTYNGDSIGGASGADSKCNSDANKPNSSTYKALIADSSRGSCASNDCSAATDWPLAANKAYVRSDGVTDIGTTTVNKVFAFNLTNAIAAAATITYTGLTATWTNDASNCTNWTAVGTGMQGIANEVDGDFLNGNNTASCALFARALYCVEQ